MMLSFASRVWSRPLPQLLFGLRNVNVRQIQSQTRPVKNIQRIIDEKLDRIDSSIRRTGRVTRRDMEDAFKYATEANALSSSQCIQLIRCCGSPLTEEPVNYRNDLVQKIFGKISETSQLDISHYNSLLQVYIDNEYEFNPLDFLSEIQSKGIEPNRVLYQRLIHRFCQSGDISGATKILEFMKSKELPVNESVFNSLILGYGRAGDLQSAYETLDVMKSSGLEPSSDTYTALLCAFASDSKNPESVAKIEEILEEVKTNEISLTDSELLKVIKAIGVVDTESPLIDDLLNNITKSFSYNHHCMNIVLDLVNNNKLELAFKLYDTMKPPQQQLNRKSVGNTLIRQLIKSNISPEVVFEFCEKLKSKGLNDYAIIRATEYALTFSDRDTARTYLKRMVSEAPLRVHYFWPILAKSKNEAEIFEILSEDMTSLSGADFSSLHDTFAHYVWPKQIIDKEMFMDKCKSVGFSYALSYNALLSYNLENNNIEAVAELLSSPKFSTTRLQSRNLIQLLADAFVANNDIKNVIKSLKELLKNPERNSFTSEAQFTDISGRFLLNVIYSNSNAAQELLAQLIPELEKHGLKISNNCADAIRERVKLSEESDAILLRISVNEIVDIPYYDADDLTKPRKQMSIQELEDNLIELKSKGLNPRGVLRSLLLAYCRRTRFAYDTQNDETVKYAQKRVKEIFEQLVEQEFEMSNAMYAALVEFYTNCENIEEAVENRKKISNDFVLDSYKILNLASLFIKKGDVDGAIDLIKSEMSGRNESEEAVKDNEEDLNTFRGRNIDRNINRLLNNIIDVKKDPKLVKQVFELCKDFAEIDVTTLMASPLVKVHVVNEDYSSALTEFVECVTKYKVTPFKNELMRAFLEKGDPNSLQVIIDHSNTSHGEMNTLVELASVCISVGKIKQAKKLIDTPGLRVRPEKLDYTCERFIDDDKIEDLEQFILITKNLFDVNRDRLFYYLIKGYIKQNKPEKALNVWTLMQEENVQPSDKTLLLLAQFLQQNNIAIPFSVPEVKVISETRNVRDSNESSNQKKDVETGNELLNQLNGLIRRGEIDEALNLKRKLDSKGKTVLMSQNCSLMEALLNADRINEALNIAQSLLQSKQFPSPRILKHLLNKVASTGDLKLIESLKPLLPDTIVRNSFFTTMIANAYISAGKAEILLNEVLPQLSPFPLGGILSLLSARPDLEEQVVKLANQLAEETEYHLPLNMVWIHYMQTDKYDEANKVFKSNAKLKDFLLFSTLLDKIRENKNVVLARNLIDTLSTSNLYSRSIGAAYSSLIDVLIDSNEIQKAEDIVTQEIANSKTRIDPKTKSEQKIITIEHLSRSTVMRLINSIRDVEKREPKFSLPKRSSENQTIDDSSGSSSDDEAVGVEQK